MSAPLFYSKMHKLLGIVRNEKVASVIKWAVTIVSLFYLGWIIAANYSSFVYLSSLTFTAASFFLFLLLFWLMLVNWGVEAYKWQWSIVSFERITYWRAFVSVWAGMAMGVFTPNRIGELAARGIFLLPGNRAKVIAPTSICSFAQMLVSLIMGLVGMYMYSLMAFQWRSIFSIYYLLLIVGFFVLLVLGGYFFRVWLKSVFGRVHHYLLFISWKYFFVLLGFSFIRYFIFVLQYNICLHLLGVAAFSFEISWGIMIVYFFTTIIPSNTLGEIGIRGSVAAFVLSEFSSKVVSIISASFLLWLVNLCIPALVGLLLLWKNTVSEK